MEELSDARSGERGLCCGGAHPSAAGTHLACERQGSSMQQRAGRRSAGAASCTESEGRGRLWTWGKMWVTGRPPTLAFTGTATSPQHTPDRLPLVLSCQPALPSRPGEAANMWATRCLVSPLAIWGGREACNAPYASQRLLHVAENREVGLRAPQQARHSGRGRQSSPILAPRPCSLPELWLPWRLRLCRCPLLCPNSASAQGAVIPALTSPCRQGRSSSEHAERRTQPIQRLAGFHAGHK